LNPANGTGSLVGYIFGILIAAIIVFVVVWLVIWFREWVAGRLGLQGKLAPSHVGGLVVSRSKEEA
jgi:small neutral amino acid transporter SnatA (MarC family)